MSARAVHRRPGWCAGLSMASYRIGHYEHGNGENPRGWHTGSGMLYWWGEGHGDQYSDCFWPTVDPYRLPGTTVSTRRLADGAGAAWGDTCPPGRWVGGATDGTYATVGQHLNGLESTMEAVQVVGLPRRRRGLPGRRDHQRGRRAGRDRRGQPRGPDAPLTVDRGGLGAPGGPRRLRHPCA